MNKIYLIIWLFFLFISTSFSQKTQYPIFTLADSLKQNANSVLRYSETNIDVITQQKYIKKTKKVISVLNEQGFSTSNFAVYFDKTNKVKSLSFLVLDALGLEIKEYKKRDFRDVSVGDGFSVFSDSRAYYLDYTPTQYPFTIVFENEIESSNTAFLGSFNPIFSFSMGIEKSNFTIKYPSDLGFHYKEQNFTAKIKIKKTESQNELSYSVSNIKPAKYEANSPSYSSIFPSILFRLEKYNLEGLDGQSNSWEEYGTWFYNNLIAGSETLPIETQNKIKQLVGAEKNPLAIAKIIYKYVQDKTRYVSIQVGIGGFKPMLAQDVDRLGYGDCKALSNYTRSLLNVVGVKSYNTIIYGGNEKESLKDDFPSVQGNHMILALPIDNKYVFLECTSQTNPFGYQAGFTDNRKALVIKPEKSELVLTKVYLEDENLQTITGNYSISNEGKISGNIQKISSGSQYNNDDNLDRMQKKDQVETIQKKFININNLKVSDLKLQNKKETIEFVTEFSFSAENYAVVSDKIIFVANAFNNVINVPRRYRNRENTMEIDNGFIDFDTINITIPQDYSIEVMPPNIKLDSKFGSYEITFSEIKDRTFVYKRSLKIFNCKNNAKSYDEYRLFLEQVARNDNSKVLLKKN